MVITKKNYNSIFLVTNLVALFGNSNFEHGKWYRKDQICYHTFLPGRRNIVFFHQKHRNQINEEQQNVFVNCVQRCGAKLSWIKIYRKSSSFLKHDDEVEERKFCYYRRSFGKKQKRSSKNNHNIVPQNGKELAYKPTHSFASIKNLYRSVP